MMLGGGGYTLRNVPRAWTYESGLALGIELENTMPEHEYREYFYPEYKLQTQVSNMENANTPEYLNSIPSLTTNLGMVEPKIYTVKNLYISDARDWHSFNFDWDVRPQRRNGPFRDHIEIAIATLSLSDPSASMPTRQVAVYTKIDGTTVYIGGVASVYPDDPFYVDLLLIGK